MKLEKVAKKAIVLLQERGVEGINTADLAEELKVPKRRIYDLKAVLRAANLIETNRDRTGTTIYWKEAAQVVENINTIDSKRIKISTSGLITKVSNSSNEVVIEGTSSDMNIEALS